MEYKCLIGIDDDGDKGSSSLFELRPFQEIANSRKDDSIQLRPEHPYGLSRADSQYPIKGSICTARLQHDRLIFPVTLQPSRQTDHDHSTYISLQFKASLSSSPRTTTPYQGVTVQYLSPSPRRNDDQNSIQIYDSKSEIGRDVHLVMGIDYWTVYITNPNQRSYGSIPSIGDEDWLKSKTVGEGQTPSAAEDGSLFFQDYLGEWFGLQPVGQEQAEDEKASLNEGKCWTFCA